MDAGSSEWSVARPFAPRPFGNNLRVAFVVTAAAATLLAVVESAWIGEVDQPYSWLVEAFGLVGLATLLVGLWLWDRRPANRTGLLLAVTGGLLMAAAAGNAPNHWMILIGVLFAEAAIAALLHLVLAFPSGKLRDTASRRLVVLGYLSSFLFQIPIYVFSEFPFPVAGLRVEGHASLADLADDAQAIITNAALIAAVVLLVRRWRAAVPNAERRVLLAVYAYGVFTLASFPISARLLGPVFEWNPYVLFGCQLAIVAGVPFVFAAAMLSGSLARTVDIGELASWLGTAPGQRPHPRDALARALGDPSLQILYELEGNEGEFVDTDGIPTTMPTDDRRGIVPVDGQRHRTVVTYDSTLVAEPAIVLRAARVAALAIDHERLTAELRASQSELRESRARILEYGESERRRLAQDLHDGVQGRLVVAALQAGRLASKLGEHADPEQSAAAELRDALDAAITALRHVVHGVMPPVLEEHGLFAALDDLLDGVPIDTACRHNGDDSAVPIVVATCAYFVAAEAVANALKHAAASRIEIVAGVAAGTIDFEIRDDGSGGADEIGSGLRGMRDRVAALGGVFDVDSPAGGGTRISVVIPCAS